MRLTFTLFAFCGLLLIGGCSSGDKDGSDPEASKASLTGRWELARTYDSRENKTSVWGEENGHTERISFRDDDTYLVESRWLKSGEWQTETRSGTYAVKGAKIVLTSDSQQIEPWRIETLSVSALIVVWSYTDGDGLTYFERAFYDRIG